MAYQRQTNTNTDRWTRVRRAILGLAALATCAVVYLHLRATDAAERAKAAKFESGRRQELISHYKHQIEMIEINIASANRDLEYAETVIEKTEANRKLADLERERRQYRTRIKEVENGHR